MSHGRALYLTLESDSAFAVLHEPPADVDRLPGLLVCPPFGWDELCMHRAMRVFAERAARVGHPVARLDLPGAGDSSGSPRDPGRLAAWTAAVTAGAGMLRDGEGCGRIVAFGTGLGGMLAYSALATGAPIDDLVLWSVAARGSLLLRELRAFARMVDASPDGEGPAGAVAGDPDDGSLSVAGFVLSAETARALEGLDLTAMAIPDPVRRRALMLGRDTLAPDRRLREHLERAGVELTIADGAGYGAMMVDPQLSEIPDECFGQVLDWLGRGQSPPAGGMARASLAVADSVEMRERDAVIRERPFEFEHRGRVLRGVLAEPVSRPRAELCAVLLNAGGVRRIGPHRMWVEDARRWAALGVPTLRFDMAGMGDSDGDERRYLLNVEFHQDGFSDQVLAALDALEAQGLPRRFLLCGVCSGAYWSFHAALADERVSAILLVNLLAFFWSDALGAARDTRRTRALLRRGAVGEIVRIVLADRWRIARMVRTKLGTVLRARRAGRPQTRPGDEIALALDGLRERAVEILLVLGDGEPLYEDFLADGMLERLGRWPNLRLERVPTDDHVFRALWAQRFVAGLLDSALLRALGGSAPPSNSGGM